MPSILFGEGEGFYTSDFKKYADIEDFLTADPVDPLANILRWENVHYDCSVGHKRCLVTKNEFLKRTANKPVTYMEGGYSPYLINTHIYNYERSRDEEVTAINVPEVPVIIATKSVSKVIQLLGDFATHGNAINAVMGINIDSLDITLKKGSVYVISCN